MNKETTVDMWVAVTTIILVALTVVVLSVLAFKQVVVNTIVDEPPAEEQMIILDNEEVITEEPAAPAEEPVVEPVEEEIVVNTIEVTTITYTVVEGDSLWKIAGELLDDPTEWPSIWGQNADQIEDPDLIFPGQVLTITLTSAGTVSL